MPTIDTETQGPVKLTAEIGRTGLRQYSGYLYEEFDPDLRGQRGMKTYQEMRRNDPTVAVGLRLIKWMIGKVTWGVQPGGTTPADEEAANFLESCLADMSQTWSKFIRDALSCLDFGFAYIEQVFKLRNAQDGKIPSRYDDGRIGWRKHTLISQETLLRWELDPEDGGIKALVQLPSLTSSYSGGQIAVPIEKSILFRLDDDRNNPEGVSLLRSAYRCYSADTEILTKAGWKQIPDVTLQDEVASLDPVTGYLVYSKPTERQEYQHNGKMFHQSGRYIDLLVTPNHRMYVRRPHRQQYEFIEASDLTRHISYKRDAKWEGRDEAEFILPAITTKQGRGVPEKRIPMDAWLRFLGIYLAEGHTYRKKSGTCQSYVAVTQNEGPSLEIIKQWVEDIGFAYTLHKRDGESRNVDISNLQLYTYLSQFGKSHDKYVPEFVKELSPRQISIFLEALHMGDGSFIGKTKVYYSCSKRLINDLSELLLKTGSGPHLRWQKPTTSGFGSDGIWAVTDGKARVGGNRVNLVKDSREWLDYDGRVFCLTAPPHNLLYVRRNGKSCWCGNSYYIKKNVEEIEAIGIERDLTGVLIIYMPANATTDDKSKAQQLLEQFKADDMAGFIAPQFGPGEHEKWRFEIINSPGSKTIDTDKTKQYYQLEIARSFLAQFLMLGQGDTGSFALSKDQTDVFELAITAIVSNLEETINRFMVPLLFRLNDFGTLTALPEIKAGKISRGDVEKFSVALKNLTDSGLLTPDRNLEGFIREEMELPELPEENEGKPTEETGDNDDDGEKKATESDEFAEEDVSLPDPEDDEAWEKWEEERNKRFKDFGFAALAEAFRFARPYDYEGKRQTYADKYRDEMGKWAEQLRTGQTNLDKWSKNSRALIIRYTMDGYSLGVAQAKGIPPSKVKLTQEERKAGLEAVREQLDYFKDFAAKVKADLAAGKALTTGLDARSRLYGGSLIGASHQARVASGGDMKLRWVRHKNDSCETCLGNENKVKTAKEWQAGGVLPGRNTACKGNCGCSLDEVR